MEDKSNKTSIIIALVAIALIVGGIFLLNQSISKNTNLEDNQVVTLPQKVKPKPTNFEECKEAGGFVIPGNPEECTFGGSTFVKTVNNKDQDVASNEKETNKPTNFDECKGAGGIIRSNQTQEECTFEGVTFVKPKTTENPKPKPTTGLAADEFIAVLESINGNQTNYKIVESGFPNPKWIKPGAPMNLVNISSSFNINLQVGKKYKFKANITESNTGFLINSISSITEVE